RGGAGLPLSGIYTGAFEFGITPRWMVDGALQLLQDRSGVALGRIRGETRYRFAEEGKWPLDVATSFEYELERPVLTDDGTEHTLTARLVISRDIARDLNITTNLDVPVTIAPRIEASVAYAIGVRCPAKGFVRAGTEFKHNPIRGSVVLFPQLWFALPAEVTI